MDEIRVSNESDQIELSGCFYSSHFHSSAAVETAYKASLVAKDPTIIENGGLRKNPFPDRGHALLAPIERILGTLSEEERYLLAKLEDYVELGRYSVPKRPDALTDPARLNRLRNSGLDEMGQVRRLVERLIAAVPTSDAV